METYSGLYPAIIKSYDAQKRLCGVEIPGLTDGADEFLQAEISYPIGDKTQGAYATEIEILTGDKVHVMFLEGDARKPIVMGYRCPQTGNATGTRRWHHAAIQILADGTLELKASLIKLVGDVAASGGALTHDGTNVGKTHTHSDPQGGSTSPPN